MKLVVMDMPEDSARLAAWLERHLVGLDLGRLVAELAAVHAATGQPGGSVRVLLGDRLDEVLRGGLGVLPPPLLRRLLRQPLFLLELQELVLTEGGPYWDGLSAGDDMERLVESGRRGLPGAASMVLPLVSGPRRWNRWAGVLAAVAAVLLLGFLSYPLLTPLWRRDRTESQPPPRAIAWGWAKPAALPEQATSRQYLDTLADEAAEWFRQRPADRPALAQRLGEFRQGCAVLLAAEHRPLPPIERDWLRERCFAWKGKLDRAQARLDAGDDVDGVRAEVDAIAESLVTALRQRAAGLGNG